MLFKIHILLALTASLINAETNNFNVGIEGGIDQDPDFGIGGLVATNENSTIPETDDDLDISGVGSSNETSLLDVDLQGEVNLNPTQIGQNVVPDDEGFNGNNENSTLHETNGDLDNSEVGTSNETSLPEVELAGLESGQVKPSLIVQNATSDDGTFIEKAGKKIQEVVNKTFTNINNVAETIENTFKQWVQNYKCSNSSGLVQCVPKSKLFSRNLHAWRMKKGIGQIPNKPPAGINEVKPLKINKSLEESLSSWYGVQ